MRPFFAVILLGIFSACAVHAADPQGFAIWKTADIQSKEKVLDQKIAPDHSARETLGQYDSHVVRLIHRVATGTPEFHPKFVDLWIIESGRGSVVVGGALTDPKPTAEGNGEMTGSSIKGGEIHDISAGDVVHIPANTAHLAVVAKGSQLTYLHPTQKPVCILTPLIECFSTPGDVVLDPFCGSGSTLVAAQQQGRQYVGIELDRRYFELAKDRLTQGRDAA